MDDLIVILIAEVLFLNNKAAVKYGSGCRALNFNISNLVRIILTRENCGYIKILFENI